MRLSPRRSNSYKGERPLGSIAAAWLHLLGLPACRGDRPVAPTDVENPHFILTASRPRPVDIESPASLTIQPMSHVSCTAWSSLSNGLKRSWPGQTRHFSPNGSVTDIPILKKSPKRKGGHPLRRRSQLPPGPYALPNLGAPGGAAANPHDRAKKHLENIWHNRTLLCSTPLSLPEGFHADTYIDYLENGVNRALRSHNGARIGHRRQALARLGGNQPISCRQVSLAHHRSAII